MTKKRKIAIIVLSVIVALVLAGTGWLAAFYFYRPSYLKSTQEFDVSTVPYGEELTVMSYNLRFVTPLDCGKHSWFYRADLVLDIIGDAAPDLLGVQEMNVEHEEYLTSHLKGYSHRIVYRDNRPDKNATGIFYRAERFTLIEEGQFWLSETPDKESRSWGTGNTRDANYVVLHDKKTDKTFALYNTHLDSKSALARENGIKVIAEKMKRHASMPIILIGDMNDYDTSVMYKNALSCGFIDSLKIAETSYVGNGQTYTKYGKSDEPRLDYCFLTDKNSKVSSYKVIDRKINDEYPSDHYPIVIKVKI